MLSYVALTKAKQEVQ